MARSVQVLDIGITVPPQPQLHLARKPQTAFCSLSAYRYRLAGTGDKEFFVPFALGFLHLPRIFAAGDADGFCSRLEVWTIPTAKMATPTPTLAEKLDKIKSPGLQSQQKVTKHPRVSPRLTRPLSGRLKC